MVRARHERGLRGHRPDHGDVGPRPGRRRRARAVERRADRRLRHVAHLGVRALPNSFRHARPAGARGAGAGRARPRPTATLWEWGDADATDARDRASARTSASWSPSAATSTTRRSWSTGPVADAWIDDRPGLRRARPAPGAPRPVRRSRAMTSERPGPGVRPDRQLLRLLRRPPRGRPRDARRARPGRRAHRRLPRRAHHAHPLEGAAEGPRGRLRGDVPDARWRTCSAPASTAGSRSSANAGGLNPRGLAAAVTALCEPAGPARPGRRVEGDDLRRPARRPAGAPAIDLAHLDTGQSARRRRRRPGHGQRLPRRLGHRRGARGRRRRRGLPAGSPTPRSWSARPRGGTAGPATTGTRSPAPSSPAT